MSIDGAGRSAVGAENGGQHQQQPERNGPCRHTIRARPYDLYDAPARAPTDSARQRSRGGSVANDHEAPAGAYLAYTSQRRNGGWALVVTPPTLTLAATFDPLAHILDVGPPLAGLGCSWHRRAILTATSAAKTRMDSCLLPFWGECSQASGKASVPGGGGQEVGYRFGVLALVEQRRHLAEPARAAFEDRVEHERLAP